MEVALGREPDLRHRETGLRSAAVGFLVPERSGTLEALDGDRLVDVAGVLEVQLAEPGRQVKAAGSNNEYLGHVMVGDPAGPGARGQVEALLGELSSGLVIR